MNIEKMQIEWENGCCICRVLTQNGKFVVTDTRAGACTVSEVCDKVKALSEKTKEIFEARSIDKVIKSRYSIKDVLCDYGLYEGEELKVITNSRQNALLIKEILDIDSQGMIYKGGQNESF